jgi:hypothetical protein
MVASFMVVAVGACGTDASTEITFEDPCGGICDPATEFCMDPGDGSAQCYPQADCSWGILCPYSDGSVACIDHSTDPLNCGGCGVECLSDELCIAGGCDAAGTACPAEAPDQCTDGSGLLFCTDTMTDPLNCGSCNYECPLGCAGGVCL